MLYENQYAQYYKDLNYNRFEMIANQSDMDYKVSERHFSGKLTKKRYIALSKICRVNTWHSHCGHDWDCCGCKCAQRMEFSYKCNLVSIRLTESFNY